MNQKPGIHTIRDRLIQMQLWLTVLILVLCSLLFTANNVWVFKRSVERNLASMSGILGRNLEPALAFADKNEAHKVLSSLQTEPGIVSATVLGHDGAVFARYGTSEARQSLLPDARVPLEDSSRLEGMTLIYSHSLMQEKELLGILVLRSDLRIFATEYRGYLWILLLVFGVCFGVAMLVSQVMQRSLSEPISELAKTAEAISGSADYSIRMTSAGAFAPIREVTSLSREFNAMLDQIQKRDQEILAANQDLERKIEQRTSELKEAQKNALNNAHAAGMAEIATGILHNIGNIVNSMNTSVDEIHQTLQTSKVAGLLKANQLLSSHLGHLGEFFEQDPKGKLLPQYYVQVGESLSSEQRKMEEEAGALVKKIFLIKEVVRSQQEYAKRGLHLEEASLVEMAEEVLSLQRSSFARHEIQVRTDFRDTTPVRMQKVKFAHILMNLLKNAKEAMTHLESGRKTLSLETGFNEQWGHFLKVTDSGEGIAPENLSRIFNHGFTTKSNGHGFGLHFCANAMTEMGGKMLTQSEGKDKGASFILAFGFKEERADGPGNELRHA